MVNNSKALVLEISKNNELLTMSIHEIGEFSSTIKHYSQLQISNEQIQTLCLEATSVLNNAAYVKIDQNDSMQQLKKVGQLLWDHLLTKQLKDKLSHSDSRSLALFLDEELIHVPWEIFYDGKEFLCLKFNLGRIVRAKQEPHLIQYRSAASIPKMLVLVNPTNDLKSSYHEGINIKRQFEYKRKEIKIDFKSSNIDTLYVKKYIRDYDIVHFAGHCEYDEKNFKNTGWQLADGRFSVKDIHSLAGSSQHLPSLIFSNACHSAQMPPNLMPKDYQQKTYSLAAAFLFSGVRHYIGTVWKVEDQVSENFAKEFYSQLIMARPIGECVREARLKLIQKYGLQALYWVGYILYGDPDYVIIHKINRTGKIKTIAGNIAKKRQSLLKISGILVLLLGVIYLYFCLPFRNPGSLFLSAYSKRLLDKGENLKVISLAKDIIKNDPLFLGAYPILAGAYERMGDKENALKYHFDHAIYSQKRNDSKSASKAYINIGWLYQIYGEYSKAHEFYNKALVLASQNNDKLNEASALRKLAVWNIDKENYDLALELLTKSSEINRDRQDIFEHRYNLACDYFDFGLVFINKDDFDTARQFYQKSKVIFDKLELKNELSDYYFNLGEVCFFEKQYDKALKFYFIGLDIDKKQGNFPLIASDYNMIGELFFEMGNYQEAEKYFFDALSILERIRVLPDLASVYYNLGILYKQKGSRSKSREYLHRASEIFRNIDTPDYKRLQQEM